MDAACVREYFDAVRFGHAEQARTLLLDQPSLIYAENEFGQAITPLLATNACNDSRFYTVLSEALNSFDLNEHSPVLDEALFQVCGYKKRQPEGLGHVVDLLLAHGATPRFHTVKEGLFHPLIRLVGSSTVNPALIRAVATAVPENERNLIKDFGGYGVVALADIDDNEEVVAILLELGYEANHESYRLETPVVGTEEDRIRNRLLAAGADPNYPADLIADVDVALSPITFLGPDWISFTSPDVLNANAAELAYKLVELQDHLATEYGHGILNRVRTAVIAGSFIPGCEQLPHYIELASYFRKCADFEIQYDALPINAMSYDEIFDTIALPVVRHLAFEQAMDASPHPSFESRLSEERELQAVKLDALNVVVRHAGFPEFDAHNLFVEHGYGAKRVLGGMPFIGTDNWRSPYFQVPRSSSAFFIDNSVDKKILGFDFRYGFREVPAESEQGIAGEQFRSIAPYVGLDAGLTDTLSRLPDQETVQASLGGLRQLFRWGGHDTVHHLLYGLNNGPRSGAPFNTPDCFFMRTVEPYAIIPRAQGYMEEVGDLVAFEGLAYLINREMWTEIFNSSPDIRERVLTEFLDYLDNLEDLAEALSAAGCSECDSYIEYLSTLGFSQLALMMPLEQIEGIEYRSSNGRNLTECIEALGLTVFELDPGPILEKHFDDFSLAEVNRISGAQVSESQLKWSTGEQDVREHCLGLAPEEQARVLRELIQGGYLDEPLSLHAQALRFLDEAVNDRSDFLRYEGVQAFTRARVAHCALRTPWLDEYQYLEGPRHDDDGVELAGPGVLTGARYLGTFYRNLMESGLLERDEMVAMRAGFELRNA